MSIVKKIFKYLGEKSFDDGGVKCKNLGKKLIYKKNVDKLLDLGCGDGELTVEFAAVVKAKEIYGIEFVDELIKKANKKGIKCQSLKKGGQLIIQKKKKDLVYSILRMVEIEKYNLLNIGTDKSISILNLAKLISRLCKKKAKIELKVNKFAGAKKRVLDVPKLYSILSFKPKTLEKGLTETININYKYKMVPISF